MMYLRRVTTLNHYLCAPVAKCPWATDVAQPDQARIVALNSHLFLKNEGHTVISIKANCIDSTAPAEHVFAKEVQKLQAEGFKALEQLTLEPYERDHAVVVAQYRPAKKQKTAA